MGTAKAEPSNRAARRSRTSPISMTMTSRPSRSTASWPGSERRPPACLLKRQRGGLRSMVRTIPQGRSAHLPDSNSSPGFVARSSSFCSSRALSAAAGDVTSFVIVVTIIALSTSLDFLQEFRAHNAVEALRRLRSAPRFDAIARPLSCPWTSSSQEISST